jgi:hypothetical protein
MELAPSSSLRISIWYEIKLMDAQEKEYSRSTLRESRPSSNITNFMTLICSIINFKTSSIQGETN